jgi:hypothetical protein
MYLGTYLHGSSMVGFENILQVSSTKAALVGRLYPDSVLGK